MSLKKVSAVIKRNKRFLITTHHHPEGDALSSELAFYQLLKAMGKRATIVNVERLPYGYDFLPGINKIKKFKKGIKVKFDCFVALDCSNSARYAGVAQLNSDAKPLINIDHHLSNERFGDINWVEPEVSSTAEMVYKLYKALHVRLTRDIALLLYVGMLTDTGCFRYPNTKSLTHKIAAELLKYNLDVAQIYQQVYENITFQDLKLLTKILSDIKCTFLGRVAWVQMRREVIRRQSHTDFDLSEYVLSFCRAIKGVEVAVLFKENLGRKDEVRVNLRSQGKIDVNSIAWFFGGGGHQTASGVTISGKIDDVRRKVLEKIKESFN